MLKLVRVDYIPTIPTDQNITKSFCDSFRAKSFRKAKTFGSKTFANEADKQNCLEL